MNASRLRLFLSPWLMGRFWRAGFVCLLYERGRAANWGSAERVQMGRGGDFPKVRGIWVSVGWV